MTADPPSLAPPTPPTPPPPHGDPAPQDQPALKRSPRGARPLPPVSPTLYRLFQSYTRRFMRRHFHAVRVSRDGWPPPVDAATPLIICMNHPSWWDPLVALLLAGHLWPDRRHFAPIDAAMLARYRFFARLGFFGIEPASPGGGTTFLKTALTIATTPNTCLWITAQGHFADPRQRPVTLAAGLSRLVERLDRAVVLPLAVEYPFWTEREPEALVRFGPPCAVQHGGRVLDDALAATMNVLAALAIHRDPQQFDLLLRGAAGSSPIYDTWRRAKAFLTGKRFSAAHMEDLKQ